MQKKKLKKCGDQLAWWSHNIFDCGTSLQKKYLSSEAGDTGSIRFVISIISHFSSNENNSTVRWPSDDPINVSFRFQVTLVIRDTKRIPQIIFQGHASFFRQKFYIYIINIYILARNFPDGSAPSRLTSPPPPLNVAAGSATSS